MIETSDKSHYQQFTPPFDIPDSWEWVRLEDIGDIVTGSTPSKSDTSNYGYEYPFYKPNDLEQGFYTTKSNDNLSTKGMAAARELPIGSVLVTCIGATIGKTGLIRTKGASNQQINAIIPNMAVDSEYLYYIIIGEYFQNSIKQKASSTTLPILNKGDFSKLLIPIPPKDEQKRIFSLIIRLFNIVSDIENAASNINESVRIAKSKILDLAMQGKLVPQDPTDEPAADMLLRINPKAKIITDNPHSWNIPKRWCWVKVSDVFAPMKRKLPEGDNFWYIDIDSIDNKQNIAYPKNISTASAPSRASRFTQKGDIVFSMVRPYLRNIALVPENDCIASTGFYVFHPLDVINSKFSYILTLSPYFVDGLNSYMKGDNSPSINKDNVESFVIPLPPQNEQQRIVAKIEKLYSVLNEIEASLQS